LQDEIRVNEYIIPMAQNYNNNFPSTDQPTNLRGLYAQYADKLLGYLLALVDNRQVAEDCVVKIFTHISSLTKALPASSYSDTWNVLTMLANKEVESLTAAGNECKTVVNNITYIGSHKYLSQMNEAQRLVFCGVYYHRKSTAALAMELNMPEQQLRLRLKEAVTIIREVKDE